MHCMGQAKHGNHRAGNATHGKVMQRPANGARRNCQGRNGHAKGRDYRAGRAMPGNDGQWEAHACHDRRESGKRGAAI